MLHILQNILITMKANKLIRKSLILLILIFNIGCDQISKNIVRQNISYNERINVIDDFLIITKVENTGAFLSLGNSLPDSMRFLLLTIFPIIMLGIAFIYIQTKKLDLFKMLGLAFIIGGGIGNLYDRLIFGSVTDFLFIDFGLLHTGIFNLADVSIMIGMIMILLTQIQNQKYSNELLK